MQINQIQQEKPIEYVSLVDQIGNRIGKIEKLEAHSNGGFLHLAFSILIFNHKGEVLLQKRAGDKYHFANLWSNSCCGHPRPGEEVEDAACRRLEEEFGFSTELEHVITLTYEAHDTDSGLTEKEFLFVFSGHYDKTPSPSPAEIGDWCWQSLPTLHKEMNEDPQKYTPWFHLLIQKVDL